MQHSLSRSAETEYRLGKVKGKGGSSFLWPEWRESMGGYCKGEKEEGKLIFHYTPPPFPFALAAPHSLPRSQVLSP